MEFKNSIKENEIIVFVDASLYSKDSIFKCLYWYSDKYTTTLEMIKCENNSKYRISLRPLDKKNAPYLQTEKILQKLERDLMDFNLRDIVTKETQNIRDLLIAKAFSNGEFDEEPPGEISDPLGFTIKDNDD